MDWLGQARTGNAKRAWLGSDMLCSALYGMAGCDRIGYARLCLVLHGRHGRLGYALIGSSWNSRRFLSTLGG